MPPDTETIGGLAEMLKFYGGWGVAAVLFFLVVWMFVYFTRLLERRHDQFAELISDGNATLKSVKDELVRLQSRLDNM